MNTLKVGLLLTALTALFVWIGRMVGGDTGMVIAFILALVMNFGSYWFSDKLVLSAVRAQPLSEQQAPELYRMVLRLAERAEVPMPRVYLVPDRSPNAFATGRNPQHGVVAVNQGLLDMLDKPEVEGVIAHELAHIKHRDTLTMAIVATLAGAIMVLTHILQFTTLFFGGSDREGGGNPLGALAAIILAPLAASMIQMAVSRAREFEADRAAADYIGTGRGLQNALLKLERGSRVIPSKMPENAAHMCIVNPLRGGGIAKLFSTHPPIEERVRKLEEHESQIRRAA